jgi:hypothetical protein
VLRGSSTWAVIGLASAGAMLRIAGEELRVLFAAALTPLPYVLGCCLSGIAQEAKERWTVSLKLSHREKQRTGARDE